MARLKEISDDWLQDKNAAGKGFSVDTFAPEYARRFPTATVSFDGEIVAFATIRQTDEKRKAMIDVMRHVHDAPSGLMEYLLTGLLLSLKDQGFTEFSLGDAPLSGREARSGDQRPVRNLCLSPPQPPL